MDGHDNPTFTSDDYTYKPRQSSNGFSNGISNGIFIEEKKEKEPDEKERPVWSNKVEFLMSCIALSVNIN